MWVGGPPVPPRTAPSYRYPLEKHLTPTHCAGCGAQLLLGDTPTALYPLVDVSCLCCSRIACELRYDGMWQPPTSAQFAAMPTQQGRRGRPVGARGGQS